MIFYCYLYIFFLIQYYNQLYMENKYILYTYFRSSTSWRVRIVLNLKKIPVEYKYINLLKGQQKSQEYLKINPNGGVPAFQLSDGTILIQSLAIIDYLQQVHPEIPLYPKDPVLKARVKGFCEVINSGIHPYQNLRLLQIVEKQFNSDKIAFAKQWVNRGMKTIEQLLAKSKGKYCFGDQITVADAVFMPQVQGAIARFGVDITQYPNSWQVLKNLQNEQAFVTALPKNQADFV